MAVTSCTLGLVACLSLCLLLPAMVAAGGGVGEGGTGGGQQARVVAKPPAVPDSIPCIPGDHADRIRCANSCDSPDNTSPCKDKKGYKCINKLCVNATTFLGVGIPADTPCQPIYVNTATGKIDKSCSPTIWPCVCPAIYAPVCGVNNQTYNNECEAKCANVVPAYKGKCKKPCVCPMIYAPVCGKNGKTYDNACVAKCAGVAVAYKGKCCCTCKCPKPTKDSKVCGKDGKTYPTKCHAKCKKVAVAYKGGCKPPCIPVPLVCHPLKPLKCCPWSYCKLAPGKKWGKCTKCLKPAAICKPKDQKERCCPGLLCKLFPGKKFGRCVKPCNKVGAVCNVLKRKECCPGLTCYGGPIINIKKPWGKCMKKPPMTKG